MVAPSLRIYFLKGFTMATKYYFFPRLDHDNSIIAVTVSKKVKLPKGDFQIDEYMWGKATLWFVTEDKFNADERQDAYEAFLYSYGNEE